MASNPITSWQIYAGKVEIVAGFTFLGSKITADGDCSHEIKTHALWKESYDKPRQHIKKWRHHFASKGPYSQSCVFSNESILHLRWPKYWSFSFSISPSNEYSGLMSFRIDWFDLAVQGALKSLLQHHSLKTSIL